MELVLGVDAGGTSTRALVATLGGQVIARGAAAGGNPISSGTGAALRELRQALEIALRPVDAGQVAHAVIGMAGDELAGGDTMRTSLDSLWRSLGLTCAYEIVGDAVVAFAGATPARAGAVLIAGTGAIAVRVEDGQVTDFAGGLGWLLGDEGAGFWFGRAAVRLAVATAQARAHAPDLTARVVAHLLGEDRTAPPNLARRLIVAACERPPLALSALAPLVFDSASAGEPEALVLLDEAADHLDRLLAGVHPATSAAPVVFAGSCLANPLLHDRVATRLRARTTASPLSAGEGAAGAAWLAASHVLGAHTALVHATLVRDPDPRPRDG